MKPVSISTSKTLPSLHATGPSGKPSPLAMSFQSSMLLLTSALRASLSALCIRSHVDATTAADQPEIH
jgi:hypothetical protein